MIGKRRSVQSETFALAFSTLGPSWASRLEVPGEAEISQMAGGIFKRFSPCQVRDGFLATIVCMLGLSV